MTRLQFVTICYDYNLCSAPYFSFSLHTRAAIADVVIPIDCPHWCLNRLVVDLRLAPFAFHARLLTVRGGSVLSCHSIILMIQSLRAMRFEYCVKRISHLRWSSMPRIINETNRRMDAHQFKWCYNMPRRRRIGWVDLSNEFNLINWRFEG